MARQTIPLGAPDATRASQGTLLFDLSGRSPRGDVRLQDAFAPPGAQRWLQFFSCNSSSWPGTLARGNCGINLGDSATAARAHGQDFRESVETGATFELRRSDGASVSFVAPNSPSATIRDAGEQYAWKPGAANLFDPVWRGYSSHTYSLIIDDGVPVSVAPSFDDATGDALTTQVGSRETVTVPEAEGTPTPTYAAVGSLPSGVTFDASTRVLTVAPTAVGRGTITIRATNSAGRADWTVAYNFAAPTPVAPSFATSTGTAISAKVGQSITDVTVPAAAGRPTPTYAVVGSLPRGLAFNTNTRVLSGTPTAAGFGRITIRATNSQGNDDWTVSYTILGPLLLSDLAAPTGRMLTGAALLQRTTADPNWYADSNRGGTDAVLDGSLDPTSGDGPISRIYLMGTQFRFNDNTDWDQGTYWASGGDGHDLHIHVMNDDREVETISVTSTTIQSSGGNFVNFQVPQSFADHLNTIDSNERWIIGFSSIASVTPVLPDATAPTVTIDAVADFDEGNTQQLNAQISGGTYDTLTYAWSDGGAGGSFSDNAIANPVYTPADVSRDTTVTVTCTVTAQGTGTNAKSSTSGTASDTEDFIVQVVLPVAAAGTVSITNPISTLAEDETHDFDASSSGGTYDTVSYAWSVVSGGGSITNAGVYTPPDVSSNRAVRVRVIATYAGTGTNARNNTSATDTTEDTFTVTPVAAPLPLPGSPRNLADSATTHNEITWGWDAPNTGGAVATYEYRTASGANAFSGSWTTTGASRSVTVSSLSASSTYRIQVRARNATGASAAVEDSASTTAAPLPDVAPVFADNTGDPITITDGQNIPDTVVPLATGRPLPTYAPVGDLPDGITFTAATRTLAGTPTATGTSTITIRATNRAGTADWTVSLTVEDILPRLAAPTADMITRTSIRWNWVDPNG